MHALYNDISQLHQLADHASIDPSTAHYHLRNLIREGRVIKISRGTYRLRDKTIFENRENSKSNRENSNLNFEKIQRSRENVIVEKGLPEGLSEYEKKILLEILKKDNTYVPFTTEEIGKECKCAINTVLKYSKKLEEKRLITRKMSHGRYVFLPTSLAIEAISDFFSFLKNRENSNKRDSNSCKSSLPPPDSNFDNQSPDIEPVSFDTIIKLIQKNAHRFIIQFKLLRCKHRRLKNTGWIFGPKSIHKHLAQAYIFKSKDPTADVINVLPKDPIIFHNEIEFQTKIIHFTNEIIDRLKEYGITIDLSEPAEIKLQHEARENDPFATKIIKKGLLYFKSKTSTKTRDGEEITYAVGIDKSKALHFEFEGSEAHHIAQELDAFVDDVIHGQIDRHELRTLPQQREEMNRALTQIQETQSILHQNQLHIQKTQTGIENFQSTLHQNQLRFSHDLVSHVEMIKQVTEYTQSINQAAQIMREAAESLKEAINSSPFRRFLNFIRGGPSE